MTDIVQRLRNFCVWNSGHSHYDPVPVCQEGATEIERLRMALKPFVQALESTEAEGFKYHNVICGAAADKLFYQDFERAALALSNGDRG